MQLDPIIPGRESGPPYRKVRDRSATSAPEQQKNIAAIVWLYRGQQERFLKPVESYIAQAISEERRRPRLWRGSRRCSES